MVALGVTGFYRTRAIAKSCRLIPYICFYNPAMLVNKLTALPPDELRKLKRLAKASGTTVNALIRIAIRRWLADNGQ